MKIGQAKAKLHMARITTRCWQVVRSDGKVLMNHAQLALANDFVQRRGGVDEGMELFVQRTDDWHEPRGGGGRAA